MLYHFTGDSEFLVKQAVKTWKKAFIEKHGDFNLFHIKNLYEVENHFLGECLTSSSFLNEKKFIIIDLNDKKGIKFLDEIEEKDDEEEEEIKGFENFLISLFDKIPEENTVLFNSINLDKRGKIFKELQKKAETKEFNVSKDLNYFLLQKYKGKISNSAINTIIKYKSSNLNKIIPEIEKLFINYENISEKEIVDFIYPELEESIFLLIDDLLNLKIIESFKKIEIILESTNIYGFYNNILANLRVFVFIGKLKNLNLNKLQIAEVLKLGNRTFLIDKIFKIDFEKLENLYLKLVEIDKNMKFGNLIGSDEKDIKFEIEKIIIEVL